MHQDDHIGDEYVEQQNYAVIYKVKHSCSIKSDEWGTQWELTSLVMVYQPSI